MSSIHNRVKNHAGRCGCHLAARGHTCVGAGAAADGDDDGNADAVGAWSSSLPDSSSGHAGGLA